MSQTMFSIIVPCYNVSNYIDECMTSIMCQSYNDFEVILVDDGSTDDTNEKCHEWERKDARVTVVKRENGGLSAARNTGVENANGKYLVFIDSDDTIHQDSLLEFSKALKDDTEVLITRLVKAYPDSQVINSEGIEDKVNKEVEKQEAIQWIMKEKGSSWPAPQYIISRELVEKSGLRFKEGYLHEDIDWTTKMVCVAKTYSFCAHLWYYHRMQRPGSITTVVKVKRVFDVFDIVDSFINGSNKHYLDSLEMEERKAVVYRLVESAYSMILHYPRLETKEDKKAVTKLVNEHKDFLKYTKHPIKKGFYWLLRCTGASVALNVMALVRK